MVKGVILASVPPVRIMSASPYLINRNAMPIASLDEAQVEIFRSARAVGTQDRLDAYLSSRGGLVDIDEHVVRTDESAWGIAQAQNGLPLWVLSSFNEDLDLDYIGIGQRLSVPVLGDTLASLEEEEVDSIDMETIGLPIDYE